MAQLVARLSGGQEAVSSSLATPTNKNTTTFWLLCFLFVVNSELTYTHSSHTNVVSIA